jgi:hypothetical protein
LAADLKSETGKVIQSLEKENRMLERNADSFTVSQAHHEVDKELVKKKKLHV